MSITKASSTITWVTNYPSTSVVNYSQNANLSANKTSSSTTAVTNHSLTLTPLNSGTKYYYRVTSINNSGTSTSSPISFFSTSN
jgi:hypothetical protein